MNNITLPDDVNTKGSNTKGRGAQRTTRHWLRFSLLPAVLVLAFTVLAVIALVDSSTSEVLAQGTVPGGTVPGGTIPGGTVPAPSVIYLGFKHSDEIEFEGDTQEDFVYKNEDIVAFAFATGQFSIFFDGSECGLEDANLDDFLLVGLQPVQPRVVYGVPHADGVLTVAVIAGRQQFAVGTNCHGTR